MGRIEYRKCLAHILAERYAFRCRCIRPIFNSEVKSDKLPVGWGHGLRDFSRNMLGSESHGVKEHSRALRSMCPPRARTTARTGSSILSRVVNCASICGADTWNDIEQFARAKRRWLEGFLEMPHGIPLHDTFARVLTRQAVDAKSNEITAIPQLLEMLELSDGRTTPQRTSRCSGI